MKRILLPVFVALAGLSACSTTPKEQPQATSTENHWQENGLRFPASIDNASLEDRYCSALSTFNMKISQAKGAIPRSACQELIRSNSSVCSYFAFCHSDGSRANGQARTRVNLMIDSLNEKIAGGAKSIRSIDNLKFKSRLQDTSGSIGFSDLFQQISNGQD